ncbi:MAG: phospholipase D-like domain-containing protein [Nannocystaceae bacterium]
MVEQDEHWDFSARGPYPRRAGNQVIPWIDGLPFYTRLAQAFRQATTRIWAIVSFIEPGFTFPDGTLWWKLLASAQARGVDVRVLFWRNPTFFNTQHVFLGGPRERDKLRQWNAKWAARWDCSGDDPGHCHHQKAYVVDGLTEHPIGFVGGMVLSHATLAAPGHRNGMAKHDVFLELHGPVVADTEHNFVQRWNFACQDEQAPPWPTADGAGPLAFPDRIPGPKGEAVVQLSRTIKPGAYPRTPPPPGGLAFDTHEGEAGILDHYRGAFAF